MKTLKNEFVPYEQALALKELGFDEPCIRYYWTDSMFSKTYNEPFNYNKRDNEVSAPLYQQTFRWFRKEHGKDSMIVRCNSTRKYFFDISWFNKKNKSKDFQSKDYKTHEEAELQCLIKLIELCKQNSK